MYDNNNNRMITVTYSMFIIEVYLFQPFLIEIFNRVKLIGMLPNCQCTLIKDIYRRQIKSHPKGILQCLDHYGRMQCQFLYYRFKI